MRCLLVFVACVGIIGNAWLRPAAAEKPRPVCAEAMATAFGLNRNNYNPDNGSLLVWIDPATPSTACTTTLVNNASDTLQLVFSDEFEGKDRNLAVGAKDPKWTAEDMYYRPTNDLEVYKPEQVKVTGGSAVVTFSRGIAHGDSQQPDGKVVGEARAYKSGFVSGWNKFAFTGGYVEARVQLPGDDFYAGLWPAVWMMGNLGRAGYTETTSGFWPYSYSTCQGSTSNGWSDLPPQVISACADKAVNRTKWGMTDGTGRGAPEIDIMEARVNPGNDGTPSARGPNFKPAQVSQTLQMGPLIPPETGYEEGGIQYPGSSTKFKTQQNPFQGNALQNSISAVSDITADFYTNFHTFGVDWSPDKHLRWYIDGTMVYEITKEALAEVTAPSGDYLGPRLIPVEPMYIIFNLAMSLDYSGEIDIKELALPARMSVDFVRVYQRVGGLNIGVNGNLSYSPNISMDTSQYIACHRSKYITRKSDNVLITETCNGAGGCLRIAAVASTMLLVLAAAF